ncbi:MAG: PhoX family phosphatase [Pseudomonadota bacterium]
MQDDDRIVNPRAQTSDSLDKLITRRLTRRRMLQGALAAGAAVTLPGLAGCEAPTDAPSDAPTDEAAAATTSRFNFAEIQRGSDHTHHVPEGYDTDVLLRWGDPLFADSPAFDPTAQTAAAQARQFGYNCDFIGFVPLPQEAGQPPRGLLCVNHEYTSSALMFPGVAADYPNSMTEAVCAAEMAAHGGSVVEIAQINGQWQVQLDSPYNRRIMAKGSPMSFAGPAAGNQRLAISSEPTGTRSMGTLNNCAGGITPWGTYLMAEENFHGYFLGELPGDAPEAPNHQRYGVPGGWFQWGRYDNEFNISREPNGPNRFGWVVEVDVMDPQSTPVKRTALGRFKHEGAEVVLAADGRVVVYMGDDERFEYVYKFVSHEPYDPADRGANMRLLDHGTLYVAQFQEVGDLLWLPMVHGQGPLTLANGFSSQADVVIEARRAADLLQATPMDRPEDVEAQPNTGRAYVMLTNNTLRQAGDENAANPRPNNAFGHIVEITAEGGDHGAERGRWEILLQCGDPNEPAYAAVWNPATSENGWFGSPDNCAFDTAGRLWVATDGNEKTGAADGLWGIETQGPLRGTGYAFFRAPVGAEVCGPRFSPDGHTLFLSVQHPGDGPRAYFESPTTRWPDFDPTVPPRPSVVAIRRVDGGVIGG